MAPRNDDGYSENRSIECRVRRLLERGLPEVPRERSELLRGPLGDDLCRRFVLAGSSYEVARHVTLGLFRDHGSDGRAALRALIAEMEQESSDDTWAAVARETLRSFRATSRLR